MIDARLLSLAHFPSHTSSHSLVSNAQLIDSTYESAHTITENPRAGGSIYPTANIQTLQAD